MKESKKPPSIKSPSPGDSPIPNRLKREHLFLFSILLLALILRVAALLDFGQSVYGDFLLWDERLYHIWAEKIAEGTYQASAVYEFAPLPAYVMALIYKVLSPDPLYARILNTILGVLSCYLVYLIGREMANKTTGLVAALVAALFKPFIFYSIVLLKTSMAVFLFALTLYLLVSVMNRSSSIRMLLLGLTIGLLLNVRPNSLILIPFLPAFVLWNNWRQKASLKPTLKSLTAYVLGLLVSVAPFAVRNYAVAGEFALTPSQSGFNLYLGNNLNNPDPYYRPVPFASSSPFEQGVQFTIEASKRAGRTLSPREASSYWTREVIRMVFAEPSAYLRKMLQKVIVFFHPFQPGDHHCIDFISQFVPFFKFPFPDFALLLPLGMAGMAVTVFRSRKFIAISTMFFLYGLTLVAFVVNTRYRLPLLIILIPFALMGINQVISHVRAKRYKGAVIYLSVAAAFLIIESFPVRGSDDMTAYYNTHAIVLDSKGREAEAIRYWDASSGMERGYSAFADLSLAGMSLRRRDGQKAFHYLEKIPDISFAAAPKYELIGDIMLLQGQTEEAISAYERSVEINSGQRRVRSKIIKLWWNRDRSRALEEFDRLEHINSFYKVF